MRRPTSSGSPQRAQEQARRGEESGEDRQEKDGHPHLPASRRPPSGPNGGPRPQQNTCDVEGTDAVQLPHSPQKLDTLGLRCHAQPCTPSHQRTPRSGEAHARTPHRKIPAQPLVAMQHAACNVGTLLGTPRPHAPTGSNAHGDTQAPPAPDTAHFSTATSTIRSRPPRRNCTDIPDRVPTTARAHYAHTTGGPPKHRHTQKTHPSNATP